MKEKTSNPKAHVVLDLGKGQTTELIVLDQGDSCPMNSSTNYDHHWEGPGIIQIGKRGKSHMDSCEYDMNDPGLWQWVETLMRLGVKYIDEHPEVDMDKLYKEAREEFENRKPKTSHHKQG